MIIESFHYSNWLPLHTTRQDEAPIATLGAFPPGLEYDSIQLEQVIKALDIAPFLLTIADSAVQRDIGKQSIVAFPEPTADGLGPSARWVVELEDEQLIAEPDQYLNNCIWRALWYMTIGEHLQKRMNRTKKEEAFQSISTAIGDASALLPLLVSARVLEQFIQEPNTNDALVAGMALLVHAAMNAVVLATRHGQQSNAANMFSFKGDAYSVNPIQDALMPAGTVVGPFMR